MKFLIVLFVVLTFSSFASFAQQRFAFDDDKEIEPKVERLLLGRDAGELANELARGRGASIEDWLIRVSVYARAGHRARLHEALGELGKLHAAAKNQEQILRVVRRALDHDDLAAKRIFYEQFAPGGDKDAWSFTSAWRYKEPAGEELEKWLAARASQSEIWYWLWVDAKKSRRAAGDIADEMEREIRRNPSDFALVGKYLRVVSQTIHVSIMESSPIISYESYENYERDISWLAETVKTDSPFELFSLGVRMQRDYPLVAARLFEKSLALGVSENDLPRIAKYFSPENFGGKRIEDQEKNFRQWTKKALVAIYRKNNQTALAQPLVEELTAEGIADLDSLNSFSNAGAVQSATGARAVEVRILNVENLNESSPDYWINRAAYYAGRGDSNEVRKTFRLALEKFPYVANDPESSQRRLRLIYFLGFQPDETLNKTEFLRGEFIKARKSGDALYLYELLRYINEEFEELRDEFFVNTDLLPKVLAARQKWLYNETYDGEDYAAVIPHLIGVVMESEKWNAKKRAAVWDELIRLARRDPAVRAYSLIDALTNADEHLRAIPLLEDSLKIAPVESGEDDFFDRDSLSRELFDAYLAVGDFVKAEKMFAEGFRHHGNELARIALSAAQKGKIADAVRLWKLNASLDRRNLQFLYELGKTAAQASLREFYLQMKTKDRLTDVPDRALAYLR